MTVGAGWVDVTTTVVTGIAVLVTGGGAASAVSVGVVVGVGVVRVAVGTVGTVRVTVRVASAAPFPPPPHDESAKPPSASMIAAAASPNGRARSTAAMLAGASAVLDGPRSHAFAYAVRLVTLAYSMPLLTKLTYKPVGIVCGVIGGRIAGKAFTQLWGAIAHEDEPPAATDRHRGWGRVVAAAAVQGAVFGTVKAVVDRAGATAFEHATGAWPGDTGSET